MTTVRRIDFRLAALWRFGIAITVFNLIGHTLLGFEQSWAQPLIALATAYSMEILLELIDARVNRRALRFAGGAQAVAGFLLPAHITGLAVSMLLYANDRLFPIAFATAVAIGSKTIFRVPIGDRTRHFLNPSNFGITLTLLLFPWIGIAPPYHFTENLFGLGDWILPALIVTSGSFLNAKFTRKMPLIVAWLGGFVVQALIRSALFGTPLANAMLPMTGLAFILFTFYMVSDPGTTPFDARAQVLFGLAVAFVYGFLVAIHVVFGLFFALTIVCTVRGIGCYAQALAARRTHPKAAEQMPAVMRRSRL